jgi:hypothetical protein
MTVAGKYLQHGVYMRFAYSLSHPEHIRMVI